MGFLDIPSIERRPWGILCLILNVIPFAGVGSIIAGAKSGHRGVLAAGIVQLALNLAGSGILLSGVFAGFLLSFLAWVWSVVWGIRILVRSA